jgi:dTMP kinase
MEMYGKHSVPGRLFVVEGIDGSGKSTQLALLHRWLESEGYAAVFFEAQQSQMRRVVADALTGAKKTRNSRWVDLASLAMECPE